MSEDSILTGALAGFSVELDEDLYREKLSRATIIHKDLDFLRKELKNILQLNLNLTKAAQSYSQAMQHISEAMLAFSYSEDTPETDATIEQLGTSYRQFGDLYESTIKQMNTVFNVPMTKFLKDDLDLDELNKLRSSVDKTRDNYDQLHRKVAQLGRQEFPKGSKQARMKQDLEVASIDLQTTTASYLEKLKTIQTQSRLDMMQHLTNAASANIDHYQKASLIANGLRDDVETARTISVDSKKEFTRRQVLGMRSTSMLDLGSGGKSAVEKQGYLYKANGRKNWIMRWIIIKNKTLKVYKKWKDVGAPSMGDKAPTEFELILCTVKPIHDPKTPFCFELIHPRKKMALKALNALDYQEWLETIQNAIGDALATSSELSQKRAGALQTDYSAITEMRREVSNAKCADCGKENPDWVSINTGAFICIECSGIHRSFGSHISKVRSLTMDAFPNSLIKYLNLLTNSAVNKIFEMLPPPPEFTRPTADSPRQDRIKFLIAKYITKKFMLPFEGSPEELQYAFSDAVQRADVLSCVQLILQGASVESPLIVNGVEVDPLFFAIDNRLSEVAVMLLLWGREVNIPLEDGRTPLHASITTGNFDLTQMFCSMDADMAARDLRGANIFHLLRELKEHQQFLPEHDRIEKYLLTLSGAAEIASAPFEENSGANTPNSQSRTLRRRARIPPHSGVVSNPPLSSSPSAPTYISLATSNPAGPSSTPHFSSPPAPTSMPPPLPSVLPPSPFEAREEDEKTKAASPRGIPRRESMSPRGERTSPRSSPRKESRGETPFEQVSQVEPRRDGWTRPNRPTKFQMAPHRPAEEDEETEESSVSKSTSDSKPMWALGTRKRPEPGSESPAEDSSANPPTNPRLAGFKAAQTRPAASSVSSSRATLEERGPMKYPKLAHIPRNLQSHSPPLQSSGELAGTPPQAELVLPPSSPPPPPSDTPPAPQTVPLPSPTQPPAQLPPPVQPVPPTPLPPPTQLPPPSQLPPASPLPPSPAHPSPPGSSHGSTRVLPPPVTSSPRTQPIQGPSSSPRVTSPGHQIRVPLPQSAGNSSAPSPMTSPRSSNGRSQSSPRHLPRPPVTQQQNQTQPSPSQPQSQSPQLARTQERRETYDHEAANVAEVDPSEFQF